MSDERVLAEGLIRYEGSRPEELTAAQVRTISDVEAESTFLHPPVSVEAQHRHVGTLPDFVRALSPKLAAVAWR